jgi:hypothetical protein
VRAEAGVNAAINGGVDTLAHTVPTGIEWNEVQVDKIKRLRITLIPALSLFTKLGRKNEHVRAKSARLAAGWLSLLARGVKLA